MRTERTVNTMRDDVDSVVETVRGWEGVTVAPHRFGGQEFRLNQVEIGHIHSNGLVDIPFTRAIRAQLVAENRAQPHHILPDTGWISFYMHTSADVEAALNLLRLSYLRKRLARNRRDPAQQTALMAELAALPLSPELRALVA